LNFDLKKFLKNLKLNEEAISVFLGALVIVIVGVLIVNYFKDKGTQTLPEALSTEVPSQTASVGKTHAVTNGETLWSIAEDAYGSGYNWTDIYSKNNLKSENLAIGQKLEIPEVTVKVATTAKPIVTATPVAVAETTKPVATTLATPTTTNSTSITGNSYTVVKGDSLWSISVKAYGDGYKWVNIAKANKLANPNIIHAGNVLTLPR
jgi:nucleoid-associated protein YgaU